MTKQSKQLSHVQFAKIMDEMRTHREWFWQNTPTHVEAATFLTDKVGFTVSPSTVPALIEATGVTWERKVKKIGNTVEVRQVRTRTIVGVLAMVVRELGLRGKVPPEFVELVEEYRSQGHNIASLKVDDPPQTTPSQPSDSRRQPTDARDVRVVPVAERRA